MWDQNKNQSIWCVRFGRWMQWNCSERWKLTIIYAYSHILFFLLKTQTQCTLYVPCTLKYIYMQQWFMKTIPIIDLNDDSSNKILRLLKWIIIPLSRFASHQIFHIPFLFPKSNTKFLPVDLENFTHLQNGQFLSFYAKFEYKFEGISSKIHKLKNVNSK